MLEEVVAGGGEEAALGDGAAPMAGSADALHGDADVAGGGDLADEVDVADVDSELERGGGDEDLDLAGFEALLGIEAEGARERAVMGGDVFRAEALGELEGDFFDEAASVDEDEGRSVVLGVGGELVEDLLPHGGGGKGAELFGGDLDGEIEMAALADLDDLRWGAGGVGAGEEVGDERDGVLGGGEADALRRTLEAGEKGAGREGVLATDEGFEAFERKGEVGAALVAGDRVDLVDDDGLDAAEELAGFGGGEEDVEGFGGGDEDVRRMPEHGRAVFGESVAGADGGADLRGEVAAFEGKLLDLAEGLFEVLLDVVGEGFEGGDVDDLRVGGEAAFDGLAEKVVDGDEEGGEGFAGAGGGGDEGGVAGDDGGPACFLRLSRRAEFGEEPLGRDGVGPGEGGGDLERWKRRGHEVF